MMHAALDVHWRSLEVVLARLHIEEAHVSAAHHGVRAFGYCSRFLQWASESMGYHVKYSSYLLDISNTEAP